MTHEMDQLIPFFLVVARSINNIQGNEVRGEQLT